MGLSHSASLPILPSSSHIMSHSPTFRASPHSPSPLTSRNGINPFPTPLPVTLGMGVSHSSSLPPSHIMSPILPHSPSLPHSPFLPHHVPPSSLSRNGINPFPTPILLS